MDASRRSDVEGIGAGFPRYGIPSNRLFDGDPNSLPRRQTNATSTSPAPAAAIAAVALFVALSGTAVAQSDIIISSPDQLADNVVTGPKIAANAIFGVDIANGVVSDNDLDDPQLKVRGLGAGGQLVDSDGTSVRT